MNKVTIIAEAGVNHNGDITKAIDLIKIAAAAGADYVKFQTFITELNISKSAPKASYQIKNTKNDESQFEMVKKLELTFKDFEIIRNQCITNNIGFLSTAFDEPSIDFIASLEPKYFKIPSGEITNKPYLEYIAGKSEKVILSTGMSDLSEIRDALNILMKAGVHKDCIIVLHCNTEYPTPMEDVNLLAMLQIRNEFDVRVGYSDHTLGIEVPIAAVALGAEVIEKHFTLDRNLPGPDHAASLEPDELKSMVTAIRNIEKAISGSGIKEITVSESKNKLIARKSIFIKRNLVSGHVLTREDLVMKRPGDGISPMQIDEVMGKNLLYDLSEGTKLTWKDIK